MLAPRDQARAVYPEFIGIGKIYVSDAISKTRRRPVKAPLRGTTGEEDLFARSLSQSGHIRGN